MSNSLEMPPGRDVHHITRCERDRPLEHGMVTKRRSFSGYATAPAGRCLSRKRGSRRAPQRFVHQECWDAVTSARASETRILQPAGQFARECIGKFGEPAGTSPRGHAHAASPAGAWGKLQLRRTFSCTLAHVIRVGLLKHEAIECPLMSSSFCATGNTHRSRTRCREPRAQAARRSIFRNRKARFRETTSARAHRDRAAPAR